MIIRRMLIKPAQINLDPSEPPIKKQNIGCEFLVKWGVKRSRFNRSAPHRINDANQQINDQNVVTEASTSQAQSETQSPENQKIEEEQAEPPVSEIEEEEPVVSRRQMK